MLHYQQFSELPSSRRLTNIIFWHEKKSVIDQNAFLSSDLTTMNLVNANVAAEWRFGSLYRDGLLQTATIKGCNTASRVSEPKAHFTQTTTDTIKYINT